LDEDNKAANDVSDNPCRRGQTRHIEKIWHFVPSTIQPRR
jgi:hypothetical protein